MNKSYGKDFFEKKDVYPGKGVHIVGGKNIRNIFLFFEQIEKIVGFGEEIISINALRKLHYLNGPPRNRVEKNANKKYEHSQ